MLALILMMTAAIPALAADNEIGGADPGLFGKPTSVEPATVVGGPIDESSNVNRSKDSAFIPPAFGSPASNTPSTGESLTPNISSLPASNGSSYGDPVTVNSNTDGGTLYYPASPTASESTSQVDVSYSNKFTLPDSLYNADGSIGTLSIPKLKLLVKVYEEESLENMVRGIGHFKSTSCWDGNVGFAGHNRGLSDYFGDIHTLSIGDRITYTTKLGTRTYEVFSVSKIHETDFSKLQRTNENIVTLVTCVRDVPELRWCVQARQIG